MPVYHNKDKLNKLLIENNIPITDAVARGRFYEEHFDWDYLSKCYSEGESIKGICNKTSLSYDAVRVNLLKKLGNLRSFSRRGESSYYFKTGFLFPILSPKGAYFLGWMYSDGCNTGNLITFTQSSKDFLQLKYLTSLFTDKPVKYNSKGQAYFSYHSVDICNLLSHRFNVCKRKSFKNIRIPLNLFTDSNLPYLLLGLLEGDGSICRKSLSCQLLMSSKTWNGMYYRLIKQGVDLSHLIINKLNGYGLLSVLFLGKSYFSLLHYVYSRTLRVKPMERKYYSFVLQIYRSMNGRTSPYKDLAYNVWDSLKRIGLDLEYENTQRFV